MCYNNENIPSISTSTQTLTSVELESSVVEHAGPLRYSSPLQWRSGLWMLVCLSANSGSVCQLKIWKTAVTIFLIFGMNVSYYKTKKRTGPFFREKSGSFNNHENVPKTALFWLWSDFDGKPPPKLFWKIFFMKLQVSRSITAKTACPGGIRFFF